MTTKYDEAINYFISNLDKLSLTKNKQQEASKILYELSDCIYNQEIVKPATISKVDGNLWQIKPCIRQGEKKDEDELDAMDIIDFLDKDGYL
jgi:hypothetical protein